jgi:hypothetical protein
VHICNAVHICASSAGLNFQKCASESFQRMSMVSHYILDAHSISRRSFLPLRELAATTYQMAVDSAINFHQRSPVTKMGRRLLIVSAYFGTNLHKCCICARSLSLLPSIMRVNESRIYSSAIEDLHTLHCEGVTVLEESPIFQVNSTQRGLSELFHRQSL